MAKDNFLREKKQSLSKLDKSRKGSVDAKMAKLVAAINKNPDYYTTSSCSGRTILMIVPREGKKWDSEWLFTSHGRTTFTELKKSLLKLPEEPVWFKKEGMILHVCCRTIEAASDLADSAVKAGFRRSGIIAKKRIIAEINDTEKIEVPVSMEGRLLVDDSYIRLLVELANEKQDRTMKKIRKLYKLITSIKKSKIKRNYQNKLLISLTRTQLQGLSQSQAEH